MPPVYIQAGYLLVSCSPEAVKSRAVRLCAQEIFDILNNAPIGSEQMG